MLTKPKRGEIWRVRLSHRDTGRYAVGTEMGAKRGRSERPCVVVSADTFNANSDRITVVPITEYDDGKEDTMSLWASRLRPWEDVDFDPAHASYGTDGLHKKSLIDCGQLWTVFATEPRSSKHPNDLRWDRRCGRLHNRLGIENALQSVISDRPVAVEAHELRFKAGDVLVLNLPGCPKQPALVVSSSGVDLARERIWIARDRRPLGHVTVVPLIESSRWSPTDDDRDVAMVEVGGAQSDRIQSDRHGIYFAQCYVIYTVDWRSRHADGPVGHVADMRWVYQVLAEYLDLPRTVNE